MPNLTTVTLTNGSGTGGTGTVSTLDNVIGTAGTASAQVQTVQGIASMTALKVDGSAVTQPVSLTSTTITGTTAVSIATAPVLVAGSAIIGKVGIDQTTPGTTNGVVVNNANANGQATMASSAPVVIASNQTGVPVGVTATANGATASRVNAAATTNATSLKASAGQLYTIDVFNVAAYNVFLKLYNKASAPTVGTDVPVMTIPVQSGGGYSKTWPMGLPFATGIAYAITKLQADTDTTVVVAGDLTGNTTWI